MSRLIVVSNRLPVRIQEPEGNIELSPSPGGVASGLSSVSKSYKYVCIGWPGIASDDLTTKDRSEVTRKLKNEDCHPIFLNREQLTNYYEGFSNETIWPLFHYFPIHTLYKRQFWQSYKEVNELFCEEIVKIAKPGDYVWIHDYHLMLLPRLVRERLPGVEIGYFLHIPFPSFELFRLLPWRAELLNGLLGSDLIGFHTYDYVRHFLSSVCRIVGLEHNLGQLNIDNRMLKVDAFPMGIDYEKYANSSKRQTVRQEIERIRKRVGNRKIIISIDRLDYTKGILERLEAFDWFLTQYPEYRGKITLIIVAIPSRTHVEEYMTLRNDLEQLIGRVNGEYGTIGKMPVWYLHRSLDFDKLTALYNAADVALLTPLRDGMNLISKEFVSTRTDGSGVLILGEMAGSSSELGEALVVNSNNKAAIVNAIKEALEMPLEEQIERNRSMQKRLSRYNVSRWASDFLEALADVKNIQKSLSVRRLTKKAEGILKRKYKKSRKRLFLLDYDGTLVGFQSRPEKAGPDEEILSVLRKLSDEPENEVVIISGRDKGTLSKWLGELNASLIAEHGAWIKERGKDWECIEPLRKEWKETIKPILELYADRTPGASVEEKDFSLVWHCRRSDPGLADIRTQELRAHLLNLTANLDVGVFEGSKILEIRRLGVSKARAAKIWLEKQQWNFILTAGDDYTDEEMFDVMPEDAYSIKIGLQISKAKFNLDTNKSIRQLLKELAGE